MVAGQRRWRERRQIDRHFPNLRPFLGIEAEQNGRVEFIAHAAAGVEPAIAHHRFGIDVNAGIIPQLPAVGRVQAEHAVVAGAEVSLAIYHGRRRFGVAGRGEFPELVAVGGVETEELAVRVVVEAFADVDSAIGQAGRAEGVLHLPTIVEVPDFLARIGVETIRRAEAREAVDAQGGDVELVAGRQWGGIDFAAPARLELPEQARWPWNSPLADIANDVHAAAFAPSHFQRHSAATHKHQSPQKRGFQRKGNRAFRPGAYEEQRHSRHPNRRTGYCDVEPGIVQEHDRQQT